MNSTSVSRSPLDTALQCLQHLCPRPPEIALVLGSGLGDFAEELEGRKGLSTRRIPGYPHSTVPGHAGKVVFGKIAGKNLLCFQGRVHLYEGYSLDQVIFPVHLAEALGARVLILTNAAGGVHRHLTPGSLMLIEDQIDLQFRRKAAELTAGEKNSSSVAPRPARHILSPYADRLLKIAEAAAWEARVRVNRGVLGALTGPSYETPAEVRIWQRLGVDAACMSTVAEAMEGARLGMEVLGISCITNKAAGLSEHPLNHAEVMEVANRVKPQFQALLREITARI